MTVPVPGVNQREPARVTRATAGKHEHYGSLIGDLSFEGPDGGWGQGIGGMVLTPETVDAWRRELAETFRVATLEEIVGRSCFVLRSWPGYGHNIEGVEVDGRRWTLTGFVRRHFPDKAIDPLTNRRNKATARLSSLANDLERARREIETCADGYIDWEASR